MVRNLGILASVGAAVVIIGATWFFAQAFTRSFDIGFYITTLSAAFGMFFGILTSQRAGFQIESKLPLGLLLVFIGIILIVILPGIGDGSMQNLVGPLLILSLGTISVITGIVLMMQHLISRRSKRKQI